MKATLSTFNEVKLYGKLEDMVLGWADGSLWGCNPFKYILFRLPSGELRRVRASANVHLRLKEVK